jgi:flagellar protein FliS
MTTNPYRAASAYRDHAVTTASPARLVVLVFERLVLDMERAITAIETGEHPYAHLIHAQELLMALLDALDLTAWEHAPQLAGIYAHVHRNLVSANVERDDQRVRACLDIIRPLKDAWTHAAMSAGDLPHSRVTSVVNV